jgi:hypothetical protein
MKPAQVGEPKASWNTPPQTAFPPFVARQKPPAQSLSTVHGCWSGYSGWHVFVIESQRRFMPHGTPTPQAPPLPGFMTQFWLVSQW